MYEPPSLANHNHTPTSPVGYQATHPSYDQPAPTAYHQSVPPAAYHQPVPVSYNTAPSSDAAKFYQPFDLNGSKYYSEPQRHVTAEARHYSPPDEHHVTSPAHRFTPPDTRMYCSPPRSQRYSPATPTNGEVPAGTTLTCHLHNQEPWRSSICF